MIQKLSLSFSPFLVLPRPPPMATIAMSTYTCACTHAYTGTTGIVSGGRRTSTEGGGERESDIDN